MSIAFQYDDGGRKAAGYKGDTRDCVCRAIAIITRRPYNAVYHDLNVYGHAERHSKRRRHKSRARTGIHNSTTRKYLADLGFEWVPTMFIGSGCRIHLKADELPSGRLVVNCSRHITAVIDGIVHDTHDPSRDGTRCVYGYWTQL